MVRAIPANMSLNIGEAVSTIIPARVYALMRYMFLDNIEGACSNFGPMYAHLVSIDFDTTS